MIDALVGIGFNTFFGLIGITVIVSALVFVLAVFGSLLGSGSSVAVEKKVIEIPQVKEKGVLALELEKIKTKPLVVLKDLGIAALCVLGFVALIGIYQLLLA